MQNCIPKDMIKCQICRRTMLKSEFKDHLIAHNVQQQQVQHANNVRLIEIEEFFEEEKLEIANANANAPKLTTKELDDLPKSLFQVTDDQDVKETTIRCVMCQEDFNEADEIRTLRCLHIFHAKCIDNWLTKIQGCCPICKVVQIKKKDEKEKK